MNRYPRTVAALSALLLVLFLTVLAFHFAVFMEWNEDVRAANRAAQSTTQGDDR